MLNGRLRQLLHPPGLTLRVLQTVVVVASILGAALPHLSRQLDPEAANVNEWAELAFREIRNLAVEAQLRGPDGEALRSASFPVWVAYENGDPAFASGVTRAVEIEASFRVDDSSRHVMRVAKHEWGPWRALELHLWRNGWDLRVMTMERQLVAPAIAGITLLLGAVASFLLRRAWIVLPIAALLAQLTIAGLRWGEPWLDLPIRWREWPDPLYFRGVQAWMKWLESYSVLAVVLAGAAAVLALLWDRRAKAKGVSASWRSVWIRIVWCIATLAWLDAALRSSLWPVFSDGASIFACASLALAWACATVPIVLSRTTDASRGGPSVPECQDAAPNPTSGNSTESSDISLCG